MKHKIEVADPFAPQPLWDDIASCFQEGLAITTRQGVAWQGSILDPILYQQTWENPRPEVPIASIDVVSAMNRPSLSVFAITGEEDTPSLQASPPGEH